MFSKIQFRLLLIVGALFLFSAPAALAEHGRGNGYGRGYYSAPYRSNYNRGVNVNVYVNRNRYVAPRRAYVGVSFAPGRFYAGRGYFYGGRFWARPYFGVGIGIPFGYGYRTARGCGYVDGFGNFFPAPCY